MLGLLKEQEMHGYELKKRLADVFGLATAVSFGSLYPALARLESAGAVRVVPVIAHLASDDSAAEPERRASRRRKVYGITATGAEMFAELLAGSQGGPAAGDDTRSFNLRLAFARYLPTEARLGLLEQRRALLGERLAQLAARARARRDDRYMRVLYQRQQEALSSDMSWLDGLIREERASVPVPPGAGRASPGEAGLSSVGLAEGTSATPAAAQSGRPGLGWSLRPPDSRLVPLASASQLQRGAHRSRPPEPVPLDDVAANT